MSVPTITGRMEWKGPEVDWKRQMEGFGGRNLNLEACKTPEDVNLGAPKVIVGMDT